ncbi:MAG TPA: DNA polymerase III subunit delta [Candidatus Hydrogenedentes bacterium]|nr:DNA polymerase III subunit delta [Candidatus Hydrogenedentota bacterium]
MHILEFLAQIGKHPLPPVILFAPGNAPFGREPWDSFLVEEAVDQIVKVCIPEGMHDLVFTVFYADETPISEIVDEARTMSLLGERRFILVRNAEYYDRMSGESNSKLFPLIEYIKSPSDSTVLMFIATRADARKRFYKSFREKGLIVNCPQLDHSGLERWVRETVVKHGKSIDTDAVTQLLKRSGNYLSDVNNAVQLVITYVGAAARIRLADVVAACSDVAEESVWDMTDAIAASSPEKALRALRQLLDYGKSPDEIIGTINWLFESAYRVAHNTARNMKPFVRDKMSHLAHKFPRGKLKDALRVITETHFLLRSTGVDRTLALEILVLKLSYRPTSPRA